jgi:hypothetical protein
MGYNFPCNEGCKFPNNHVGFCSTLDREEKQAVAIIKASVQPGVCPFCNNHFSTTPAHLHNKDCAVHDALVPFWRALPRILP